MGHGDSKVDTNDDVDDGVNSTDIGMLSVMYFHLPSPQKNCSWTYKPCTLLRLLWQLQVSLECASLQLHGETLKRHLAELQEQGPLKQLGKSATGSGGMLFRAGTMTAVTPMDLPTSSPSFGSPAPWVPPFSRPSASLSPFFSGPLNDGLQTPGPWTVSQAADHRWPVSTGECTLLLLHPR